MLMNYCLHKLMHNRRRNLTFFCHPSNIIRGLEAVYVCKDGYSILQRERRYTITIRHQYAVGSMAHPYKALGTASSELRLLVLQLWPQDSSITGDFMQCPLGNIFLH